ncbi:MAG TPA: hypothetical protein VFD33_00760 [Bacillota bacterium]|nr:hypothetical protein [Bacillota bacterium]
MKRRELLKKLLILIVSLVYLVSPLSASFRSLAITLPYSLVCQRKSVLADEAISLKIPGGMSTFKSDWYPIVMTFNDDKGMSQHLGEQVRFTVLYNFGSYDLFKARSTYYDRQSQYFSSFYGGYIVKSVGENVVFGFDKDGSANIDELAKLAEYDQLYLVLSSLGCPPDKLVFESTLASMEGDVEYAGIQGWTCVNSNIKTNSPEHAYLESHRAYIQYGRPRYIGDIEEDFPLINLRGRAYARYFEEHKATVVLFVMAPSWTTIDECDQTILSKTSISQ